jgi:pimeloyl-ACP methyl ester carboxylesterase
MQGAASRLHVELYGPKDAQPLILTHGWGVDSTEWHYIKRHLADRFRLIVWDLPGLGKSPAPSDGRYSMDRFAADLRALIDLAAGRPAVLVGHSIGGMIILSLCRLFPQQLGSTVAGVVLANSSHLKPTKTTTVSRVIEALQKPLFTPLMHVIIWLSPLFWVLQWLGYLNGSAHVVSAITGFGGGQTRGQIDRGAYLSTCASPAVVARGELAMFGYGPERETLSRLSVPALVVTGHLDRITIPEASEDMAETAPQGHLLRLAPAGHMGVWEQHETFTTALASFAQHCRGMVRRAAA